MGLYSFLFKKFGQFLDNIIYASGFKFWIKWGENVFNYGEGETDEGLIPGSPGYEASGAIHKVIYSGNLKTIANLLLSNTKVVDIIFSGGELKTDNIGLMSMNVFEDLIELAYSLLL